MRELSPFELGWLVGFYEGEGSAMVTTHGGVHHRNTPAHLRSLSVRVTFTQKDLEPLLRVREILGMNGSLVNAQNGVSRLSYDTAQGRAVLRLLKPHLSKRRKAQIQRVMDLWDARPRPVRGTPCSPGQLRLLG